MANAKGQIRYSGVSGPDKILRLALLNAWGGQCYWCGDPHDFVDIETDHIIPRSIESSTDPTPDELITEFLGPEAVAGYDVHALYNLAPTCRPCNGTKSDRLFRKIPKFMSILQKTRELAPAVEASIRTYESAGRVAKAVAAVVQADLEEPRALGVLTAFAPLLNARLSRLDFTTTAEIEDWTSDLPETTVVKLDRESRRIRDVLEVLTGEDYEVALANPLHAVKREISDRQLSDIASQLKNAGHQHPDVSMTSTHIDLIATELRYIVADEQFKMVGTYEAESSAHAALMAADGDGFDLIQRDAASYGTFGSFFSIRLGVISADFAVIAPDEGDVPLPD